MMDHEQFLKDLGKQRKLVRKALQAMAEDSNLPGVLKTSLNDDLLWLNSPQQVWVGYNVLDDEEEITAWAFARVFDDQAIFDAEWDETTPEAMRGFRFVASVGEAMNYYENP